MTERSPSRRASRIRRRCGSATTSNRLAVMTPVCSYGNIAVKQSTRSLVCSLPACRPGPSRNSTRRPCSGCGSGTPVGGGPGSPATATSAGPSSARSAGREVPMAYSSGFSPHPRISYANAAPTGAASEAEYLEIGLTVACDPEQVRGDLDAALPRRTGRRGRPGVARRHARRPADRLAVADRRGRGRAGDRRASRRDVPGPRRSSRCRG